MYLPSTRYHGVEDAGVKWRGCGKVYTSLNGPNLRPSFLTTARNDSAHHPSGFAQYRLRDLFHSHPHDRDVHRAWQINTASPDVTTSGWRTCPP